MGRAFALGCLTLFLVLFVGGGVYAYFNFWRPAQNVLGAAQGISRISELDAAVKKQEAFTAPEDDLLEPAAVERYLGVQEHMETTLAGRLEELQEKYAELEGREDELGLREMASAWADIMNLLVLAKGAQVDALNAAGFSREEYAWVRARTLEAAGFGNYGYDLTAAMTAAAGERETQGPTRLVSAVPDANVELVGLYRERIEGQLHFAFFGL